MPYSVRTKDGIVIRNIPDDVSPDDPSVRQRVEAARADPNLKYKQMQKVEAVDPTEGMGGFDKFAAGTGKSVADLGLGTRQLVGLASQEEVDEVKQRDAPLMNTGAGMAGNIAGNVGMAVLPGLGLAGVGKAAMSVPKLAQAGQAAAATGKYALSSPATLGSLATQGGLGAAQSGLQPTATGEDRLQNTALGFAGGAAIPAAGMALKGGKALVEPFYAGGRENIMARALRGAVGQNADDVVTKLSQARELIPGSSPTAAEVADSGGIAAFQRAASAVDPESYATRAAQQNEARVAALTELTGSTGQREFYDASRKTAANELYEKAYQKGVDITRDPTTGQFLPKAEISGVKGEITKLMKRPALKGTHMSPGAIDVAKRLAANEGVNLKNPAGSVKGLDYVKRALDDQISKATGNEQRILVDLKNRLLTTLDRISPDYAQARVTFSGMSKPINQMDIAQAISEKSINKLTGQVQPQAYARALSDDTAAAATGFKKATLANTLEPQQLATLNAMKQDLARSVAARDLGRGAGSDTVQKLAMTNLMERAGLPAGLLNFYGMGTIGRVLYSNADDTMKQELAKALLNPKEAAGIMRRGVPSETAKTLSLALRSVLSPVGRGGVPALLDAR